MSTPTLVSLSVSDLGYGNSWGYVVAPSVQAGDLLEVQMVSSTAYWNGVRYMVDGGKFEWTPVQRLNVVSYPAAELWTAVATRTGSVNIGVGELRYGAHVYLSYTLRVWRNAALGASAVAYGNGAPSLSLTTTAANSQICLLASDCTNQTAGHAELSIGSGSFTSDMNGSDIELTYYTFGGRYSDAGGIGTKTIGESGPGGQTWGMCAVEIVGA